MKCKLTGNEGKGVNAHIIPRSFYTINPNEKLPSKLLTNTKGEYPKKSPIGIYDNTILTEEGEKLLSKWDDYGAELLLSRKAEFIPLSHNGKIVAFQIQEYDYITLKLFFLSILWRASVSSHVFFKRIHLGPHEQVIRNALLAGDPKDSNWYAVSLAKWSDNEVGTLMMDPYSTKFDEINYCVLYLEHYIVYFKIDKRIPDETLQAIQLKPNSPLIVVTRELNSSKERPIIFNILASTLK